MKYDCTCLCELRASWKDAMWRMLVLRSVLGVVLAWVCSAELASGEEISVKKEELINVQFYLNKVSCNLDDEVKDMVATLSSLQKEKEEYEEVDRFSVNGGWALDGKKSVRVSEPMCPIESKKKRWECCCELYREYGKQKREKKAAKCLEEAEEYFQKLEDETYHLERDDKEYVEDRLEELEEEVASEKMLEDMHAEDETEDGTEIAEYAYEHEDEDDDDDEDEHAQDMGVEKAKQMKRKKRREAKRALRKYLKMMKKAEIKHEAKGMKKVPKKMRTKYKAFRKKLREWYDKQLMGVFFTAVTQKWMACVMVSVEDVSAGYCGYLKLINANAKQLQRKAVLGFEVGRVSQTLESSNVARMVRRFEHKTALRASMRQSSDSDVKFVDLLGGDEERCLAADLSHSCYAICCDTMYFGSFFCLSTGQQCLG